MGSFSIWHWLGVLAIVLLVFGTKRLTSGAKDLGSAVKEFKKGMRDEDKPNAQLGDESRSEDASRTAQDEHDLGFGETGAGARPAGRGDQAADAGRAPGHAGHREPAACQRRSDPSRSPAGAAAGRRSGAGSPRAGTGRPAAAPGPAGCRGPGTGTGQAVQRAGRAAGLAAAQRADDDCDPPGRCLLRAVEADLLRRPVRGGAVAAVPAVGVRCPGPVRARKAPGGTAAGVVGGAVLHRLCVRLLPGAAGGVPLPHHLQPGRNCDHPGCERLPGLRAGDLLCLRRQFRTAGGDGDPGAAGLGDAAAVQGRPRLRDRRHLRGGRRADPAGRGLAADAGHPDVPALRAGHPRRTLAGAVVGSEETRRLKEKRGRRGLSR
ncbi:hypothetical protein G6F68_010160 [Rhizopus microsporus]|nr:hypothetical protein G6F68_010160 [Rhizopus microsporus]